MQVTSKQFLDFSDAEIFDAAAHDRLLSVEVEFSRRCNYRCPYCYVGEVQERGDELTSDEIKDIIHQAHELGARKAVILGGEPLMVKNLEEHIAYIRSLDMHVEVFTNGALITEAIAAMLFKYRCRVVTKLNSLDPKIQEEIVAHPDALHIALHAIKLLQAAGYREADGLLAASSVICRSNLGGMVALWKFLREQNIIPYFEMLTPQGRLMENQNFIVGGEEVKPIFDEIAAYEHAHGNDWVPQPPLVGSKCLRHLYSCYVSISGEVYPCVGITSSMGNIRSAPLAELLAKSQVIHDLKHFRETIKEPCHSCPQAATCYGCRGATYQLTGDYLASDPMCWRNEHRQDQIVRLPYPCEKLLPHQKPIRMVEQLVSTGNSAVVRLTVRPDNPYLDASGVLERAVYPEIAAQATAVCDAFRHSGHVRPGFLAAASRIDCSSDAKVGEVLDVTVTEKDNFESWSIISFAITSGLRPVADGELKVYLLNGEQV